MRIFSLAFYNPHNGQIKPSPYFYESQVDCIKDAHEFNALQHERVFSYEPVDEDNDIAYIFFTSIEEIGKQIGLVQVNYPKNDGEDFAAAYWAYKNIADVTQPHLEFYDQADEVIAAEAARKVSNDYLLRLEHSKLTLFAMRKLREQAFTSKMSISGNYMS